MKNAFSVAAMLVLSLSLFPCSSTESDFSRNEVIKRIRLNQTKFQLYSNRLHNSREVAGSVRRIQSTPKEYNLKVTSFSSQRSRATRWSVRMKTFAIELEGAEEDCARWTDDMKGGEKIITLEPVESDGNRHAYILGIATAAPAMNKKEPGKSLDLTTKDMNMLSALDKKYARLVATMERMVPIAVKSTVDAQALQLLEEDNQLRVIIIGTPTDRPKKDTESRLRAWKTILDQYLADFGQYPELDYADEFLNMEKSVYYVSSDTDRERIKSDGWGHRFVYLVRANGQVLIISAGANGKFDADRSAYMEDKPPSSGDDLTILLNK